MINWIAVFVTMAFVAAEGVVSWFEGTLTKTDFPFLKHGGIWADFFILPLINGLIFGYVWNNIDKKATIAILLVILCPFAAMGMHHLWYNTQTISSWLWPVAFENRLGFSPDTSWAGFIHVNFMSLQLMILLFLVFTPVPPGIMQMVAVLLTLFWPLTVLQPCWMITGKWIDLQAIISSVVLVGATWVTTYYKTR